MHGGGAGALRQASGGCRASKPSAYRERRPGCRSGQRSALMQIEFRLPSLGADMESAVLTAWLKKPGERIRHGEPLATVETTKGLIDIESYDDGQVLEELVQPGTQVAVGAVLARLEI